MKKTIITVVGNDTVGIIAKVCTYLAENQVNILDISQTIVQGYFNMMMIADTAKCEKDGGELAKELDMPVIIHSRDAAQECFDMIKKSGVRKGIIHCYSGSAEMAMDYVKMGFYIGIGGVLTYSNARKTVEVAEEVPLNRIVLETDCPYLAPVPNRGKRNDSTMIKYVAEKLAEIKNISVEQVYFVTSQNAKDVFELKV